MLGRDVTYEIQGLCWYFKISCRHGRAQSSEAMSIWRLCRETFERDLRDLTVRLDRLAADLEKNPGLLLERHARRPGPGER
jgi:hypothetical protein